MSNELKPCPFCGGKGRVSFRQYDYFGQNYYGDKKLKYRVQVICNKCKSRGKPIITDWLKNPHPDNWDWMRLSMGTQTVMFQPYVEKAIAAWNRRANDE